ncbi:tyrosine-protein phosphatase [Streptomyces sp. NBC_00656]
MRAEDKGAVLVHCASGKDRTGVVVAIVQTLFGASGAEVMADVVRSNADWACPSRNRRPRGDIRPCQ